MFEFNPDGSIKIPDHINKKNLENEQKLKKTRCIKIEKDVISFSPPKKCVLKITLSEVFTSNSFIENIYNYFRERATVPTNIKKISDKEIEIEIGTDFKRCSDCSSLINKYREYLEGNVIEVKGTCTFEGRKSNFSYEDYFD